MIPATLAEIARSTQGHFEGEDKPITNISIDSRNIEHGSLFVAIKGDAFDGHSFIDEAVSKGSVAVLLEKKMKHVHVPKIIVENTREALGDIAHSLRQKMSAKIIAITGSNGKTTVKEMVAEILSQNGDVLATEGNLNNEIGVPLTLFRVTENTEYVVVEMGASAIKDIDYLGRIVCPDIGVITNAGSAHLEGLVDLDGVARVKGELIGRIKKDGAVVLNADDPNLAYWRGLTTDRSVVTFGLSEKADIKLEGTATLGRNSKGEAISNFTISMFGELVDISTKFIGHHNVKNALAATACSISAGASIADVQAGLSAVHPVNGRLQIMAGHNGTLIINDAYNANPDSCRSALDVATQLSDDVWLVLGDMAELGEHSIKSHFDIGAYAKGLGVKRIFTIGEHAQSALAGYGGGVGYVSLDKLASVLRDEMNGSTTLLIKGSRFMKLERLVSLLCTEVRNSGV